MIKKVIILGVMFFAMAASAEVTLKEGLDAKDLRTYGESAPATIYVFSSLTCPHCSIYHKNIMPTLKDEFVVNGLAQVVFVDMAFDPRAMMGAMLARCMPVENYEKFMDVMYQNQSQWAYAKKPRELVLGYTKMLGMTDKDANKCLADNELQRVLTQQRDNLAKLHKVKGMPTTVVVKGDVKKTFVGSDADVILQCVREAVTTP